MEDTYFCMPPTIIYPHGWIKKTKWALQWSLKQYDYTNDIYMNEKRIPIEFKYVIEYIANKINHAINKVHA